MAIALSVKVIADDGAGIIDARNGRAGARGLQGVGIVDDGVGSVGIEEKTVRDGSGVREISGDRLPCSVDRMHPCAWRCLSRTPLKASR